MHHLVLIAHNLRSSHNVGSLLRTADGLGVEHVFLTGYTPYPLRRPDARLPHIAQKVHKQISKTALGAEERDFWSSHTSLDDVLAMLRADGFTLAALEQSPNSQPLPTYQPPEQLALLVGREVEGVEPEVLADMDHVIEIPMKGAKESFNVAQAAAMALYHCTYL